MADKLCWTNLFTCLHVTSLIKDDISLQFVMTKVCGLAQRRKYIDCIGWGRGYDIQKPCMGLYLGFSGDTTQWNRMYRGMAPVFANGLGTSF